LWKNIFSTGTDPDDVSIGVGSITECRKPDIFFDGWGFLNSCLGIWPKLLMKPIVAFFFSGSSMLKFEG
jgi:hypothetical protein